MTPTDPAPLSDEAIDRAPRRVEGRGKVTGQLRYAGDLGTMPGTTRPQEAVVLLSTQATGRVLDIDASAALAAPGARLLMTHENAPRLQSVADLTAQLGGEIGQLLPLQDDVVHYVGQCVAVLVADTLEHARAAALLVRVAYSDPDPDEAFTLEQGERRAHDAEKVGPGEPGQVRIGDPEGAYEHAVHTVDVRVEHAAHHHNAIEPSAITASWEAGGGLSVQLPTQASFNDAAILGQAFGFVPVEDAPHGSGQFEPPVRVVAPPAGGAFGGKVCNVHLLLAPMAARLTGLPVKLVLTRAEVFTLMPFRAPGRQRVRLGTDADGRLQALVHRSYTVQGAGGSFVEPLGETFTKAYACPAIGTQARSARLDTNAPGWMRAPGASLGQFALETAMDVLADRLHIDPLELRLLNHADVEPDTGREWSSKSLKTCYRLGAERIGWSARQPAAGSMRQGRHLVGYGMATAIYKVLQLPAQARVVLGADGRALVQTGVFEIGQGALTAMTQIAGAALGLPQEAVTLAFGDTLLPFSAATGASAATLSNGAAVHEAASGARAALLRHAVQDPLSRMHGRDPAGLVVVDGRVTAPDGTSEPVTGLMARHPDGQVVHRASTGPDAAAPQYGRQAFGAQFARVLVDPATLHVRVDRLVGAFAGGRAVSPVMVRSQLRGAMIWGLGQAMMEESLMDPRTGRWMNPNLAEALVPVNADVPDVEAVIVEEDDTRGHPLGIKGMGELGVVGVSAAIGNAIHHATGLRLTSLPFRADELLALAAARDRDQSPVGASTSTGPTLVTTTT